MKTEEPEVTAPNTAVSAVGPGALLLSGLEVEAASTDVGPVPGAVAAVAAACPGAVKEGVEDMASALPSRPLGADGAAPGGPGRLALGAAGLGLLATGCTRMGSFFTGSEACRGPCGGWAACNCTGSVTVDLEPSLLPGFSGAAGDTASSVLFPEDAGREGAGAVLRRPLKDKVGNDAGRGVAGVVTGRVGDSAVSLVCWLPKEKMALLPLSDAPPKPTVPEGPPLASGRLLKTPAEGPPVPVLVLASGTAVLALTAEVAGGSAGFPSTGELLKLKPEAVLGVLAGCAPAKLGDGDLVAGFAESSTWPTRSPEKLPSVSPAKEVGNKSSPSLDGGASGLPVGSGDPGDAPGLLPEGGGSHREAAVLAALGAGTRPEGVALSGTVSWKGLLPPLKGSASSWFESLVGDAAPGAAVKLEDGAGVIIPKLKPVPDGAKEKGLAPCPAANGIGLTAASALATPSPGALSAGDS